MINSWSLLYDEMTNSKSLKDKILKMDEPIEEKNSIEFSTSLDDAELDFSEEKEETKFAVSEKYMSSSSSTSTSTDEGCVVFGNEINLNLDATAKNGFWKYEEDLTMKEVRDYLSSTYKSHYTSQDSKTQTLDLIESIGDAEPFCRSNAIKYLSRFGKKNGKSKQDILKAIHYCVLLYHFSGLHKQPKGDYETF